MNRPTIQTERLVKKFGEVRALNGLDLAVEPGMVYGFLGPNGAGKTTTMRILSGLARADDGKAFVLGEEVKLHHLKGRRSIGVLPEEPAFYRWMNPREYLEDFVAPLEGISSEDCGQRAAEVLELLGLEYAANRRIGGFSRGMRQRLGLAQALIHQPQLLLLDEPVSALDPAGRKEVLDLIESLRGEVTVLLSTHILADVERVCDVVGIIDKGSMVVEDKRDSLLARYATPIIEVELEGDVTSWVEKARRLGFVNSLEIQNDTIRLHVSQLGEAQRVLLQLLSDEGARVRRFETVKPTLEDVFLRLTDDSEQAD